MPTRTRMMALLAIPIALGAAASTPARAPAPDDEIRVVFLYGSEKKEWIAWATKAFHATKPTLPGGKRVVIDPRSAGSGEMIEELSRPADEVGKEWRAHLVSPAGMAFVDLGNANSREKIQADLIGPTRSLVASPIVVAMWRDMAERLGWGKRPISWREIFDYAREPARWQAAVKEPRWRELKFGHTHPDFSNSGLYTLFAEVYAALDKFEGVNRLHVLDRRADVERYIAEVEHAVVHYGSSTGFLADKMNEGGRDYLDATILYENLVITANRKAAAGAARPGPGPIVAIYPAEGTFLSDHPVGIVRRPWVTDAHRLAAEMYVKFLLERPSQVKAKEWGFRPVDKTIPLEDMLRPELGVDPAEPRKKYLTAPSPSAFSVIAEIWSQNKRPADVVLALDISGGMKGEEKIGRVQGAAEAFLGKLREGDVVSTLVFRDGVEWQEKNIRISPEGTKKAVASIRDLASSVGGDTALHQAVLESHEFLQARDPTRNRAIVILSDGKDSKGKVDSGAVLTQVLPTPGDRPIYIFTVAFGKDCDRIFLKKLSEATQADAFDSAKDRGEDEKNIRDIFIKIATFF